ncbi:MAG: hypothetical protein WDM81_06120 [Rhizomicrobium sp.]
MTDAWADVLLVPASIPANSNLPQPAADAGLAVVKADTRSWGGVTVRVVEMRGAGRHLCDLRARTPRLVAMLEESGGHAETRLDPKQASPSAYQGCDHLSLFPAGVPVWECAERIRHIRRVTVDFDMSVLANDSVSGAISGPRLMFCDRRIWTLASLLADECASPQALPPAYGESLGVALFHRVVQRPVSQLSAKRGGLTPRQLRQVTDRLEPERGGRFPIAGHRRDGRPVAVALLSRVQGLDRDAALSLASQHARAARPKAAGRDIRSAGGDRARERLRRPEPFLARLSPVTGSSPGQWRRMHS